MPQLLIPGRLLPYLCKCLCVPHEQHARGVCALLPVDGPVCRPCLVAGAGLVERRRAGR